MSAVKERVAIEAPYTQTAAAFERRLGLARGSERGECVLTLTLPIAEGRELARVVTAHTERVANPANYSSRYRVGWPAGSTSQGIPTPAFEGTVSLGAGEDYGETMIHLEGTYEPPGGIVGRAFDDLVGRRFAHATLAALLSGVGEELRAEHQRIESEKKGG